MGAGGRRAVGALAATATLLLVPVVAALTLARLREPWTGREVELAALTPWGLPASGLLVVVALLATACARQWWRLILGFVAATSVLALVTHAVWLAPFFSGDPPTGPTGQAGKSDRLVVMTQNLEYGSAASLVDVVRANAVDVLVLVDLTPDGRSAVIASGLTARLPFTVGADGGSLVLSRYRLGADRLISGGGDSRELTVETPMMGAVDLVALHPTPPYQGGAWRHDYGEILGRLRESGRVRPDRPRVVAGDLNATADHVALQQVLSLGYRDAVEQADAGWQPTFPAPGAVRRLGLPVPPLVQIDHVLVSAGLRAHDVHRVAVAGADHLGVVAVVTPATGDAGTATGTPPLG
ncbi:hypothetical protein DFJ68_1938 [Terracoccus luteus]|uniref:Endonuclease/exonuclease/phosphatase domain-containing protein n=1 Tax=Terracoccus luteus TaxID=53356 RepID=A0A495XWZ8_9MICO|nr:endonuclease/exonuclease/phosphatase family protein [Terracoccus luteus]RKT78492.1 hypothetical protein DFJ68_1938 [Terracoccus luteus]